MNVSKITRGFNLVKSALTVYTLACCSLLSSYTSAQELMMHDFNDGTLGPFESGNLNRITFTDGVLEGTWSASDFTGSGTNSKKTEFRAEDNAYRFTQEFWTGFRLMIHNDYMAQNTNTDAGLMQIWGFDEAAGSANHYAMLKFDGRNGGALVWYHRYNGGSTGKRNFLVYPNFPRNQFVDIIIRVRLSSNGGTVQIWADGEQRLNETGQTMGWGDMNANGQINQSYSTPGSWGMYNYRNTAGYDQTYDSSNHLFDGYLPGETRTVSYDNLSLWNGTNGYSIVDPSENGGSTPEPPSTPTNTSSSVVQLIKRNASGYAIDGNHGGADRQNIYLWSQNRNNVNQQWIEIDRGNGYYSYQKQGTNFCIDGNNGGDNGQNVYLWTCGTNNQNQHWRKVNVGSGNYRLEKRNSPGYSLDGNNGGADGQNLYLWQSNDNNQNQHWTFN